ncbi:hypothetical protein TA3x_002382 [Tundrisphaera sp. TA3]|uniref:hypothetical protein n=1 Tax=Tundrisphaera sp. TA3 TaxID=3435775 RepID=UPI003EBCB5FE
MRNRLEDLWITSADDGATSPIGIELFRPQVDMEDLLRAWALERGHSIEMGMILDQSRRFLGRLMAADGMSREDRKRARALMTLIKDALREPGAR